MTLATDELRTQRLETLITPNELARLAPLEDDTAAMILAARREIEAILRNNFV